MEVRKLKSLWENIVIKILKKMKIYTLFIAFLLILQSCISTMTDNSINIDKPENQINYQVKEGKTISFKTSVHGSVGMDAEYEIKNKDILEFENSKIIYDDPGFQGTGGDSGKKKFVFKGIKKGTTTIIIKKIYRGDLQEEIVLKI